MSTQIQYRLVIGNVSSFYTVQWTRISFACWQSRTVHSPDDWEERSFRPHALMRAGSLRHPPGKSAFAVNWPSVPLCVDVASLPAIWRFCRLCELVCISDLLPPAALYLVPPSREFCARNKFRWWKMWSVPLVLWSLVYKTFEFQFNDPDCYIFNTTLWWCADLMRLLFHFRSLFSILSGCAWITCATWSLLLSRSHELASKWNICLTFRYFCIRSEDIVSFNTSLDSRKWWSTPTATTPSQATASALKNFLFSWSFLLFLLIFPVQLHLSIFLATLIFLFIISKFYAFPSLRLFEDCQ